ncbi:MAG: Mycothiol acetyltransferase [Phycisphaerae bacterium]|nr:Mycothiol acetyltransferase [Phycisphaerae bacterium]
MLAHRSRSHSGGWQRQYMDQPDDLLLGLKPITLEDQEYFRATFHSLRQPISDYSFASAFVWGRSLALHWASIHQHLCIFANSTGDLTMLLPPIAEGESAQSQLSDCLGDCFAIMDRYNDYFADRSHSRIEYVSDEMLERFSSHSRLPLTTNPMSGDYIYNMARMIDLAGGAYKSKRHDRDRFRRRYPQARFEPYQPEHQAACRQLLETWKQHGDDVHTEEHNDQQVRSAVLRKREYLACQEALANAKPLGLQGMLLWIDELLVGFTLGEALSPAQASILIEKTHPDFPGSAQLIFSEFCRQYWSNYPECNVGDDWGLPSLRFTKQSYRPVRVLNKYSLLRQYIPTQVATSMKSAPATGRQDHCHAVAETPLIHASPDIQLRRATIADLPALQQLEQLCFSTPTESFHRRQIRNLIRNPRAQVWVASHGTNIRAWSVGLLRRHKTGLSGRLYAVAVHPAARGQHVGQLLVEYTLEQMINQGTRRIYLQVREDNLPAISLYTKLGFVDRGQLQDYYGSGRHARSMLKLVTISATQLRSA